MAVSMTKKELAALAGYTYRRLHDIDRDMPPDNKLFVSAEGGKYDAAIFVQRWVEYNVNKDASTNKSLDEVRAIHEVVKTRKTELEVERMEGRLVEVQDIRRIWGGIANTVMRNMMNLPSKVAPMIIMLDNVELISGIIEEEVHSALNEIADTPLPDYAAQQSESEGEEEQEVS